MTDKKENNPHSFIPPVVAVLGHVDHGKTTLLDAIRKTSIADREHGGITQGIGASSIEISHDGTKRKITFIDTPGHEAFAKMRSRGATVSDVGLLIVSAVDGVKPQTKESIAVLKTAGVPIIVVLTKTDLPTKNIEKVKQQIVTEGLLLESLGGDVPVIELSAKTGTNVKELLDLILLAFDMRSSVDANLQGATAVVIESKRDSRVGAKATAVVKHGTFHVRNTAYLDGESFRIRSLVNDRMEQVQKATIGEAVEIIGMNTVPAVGSIITSENVGKVPAQVEEGKEQKAYSPTAVLENELSLILVADTQGSLEAILSSFPKEAHIVLAKTGDVTESDILLAKSTGAIVVSFNTKIKPDIAKLAQTEKVLAKNYQIIYELLDEIKDVLEGKQLALLEEVYGTAQVLAKFPYEKTMALGVKVIDGRIAKGDKIRIVRGKEIVGESTIASLRVHKMPVSKIEKGNEAGVVLSSELDFHIEDVVICHN
ncbi:MAG TPA: translation initiation factor IF-2 [Patescibacteria group bacterium]|nr:translation initiation factor IF-2 [Patescibacteria group bacterium]